MQQRATVEQGSETLIQNVKDIFQDASDRRAEPIAESQTHSDLNSGRFMAMQEAGVESKAWRTAGDDRVRPAHRQAGVDYAEGIPIDEPFIVGGEALMYPGDPSGSIGNTINCRCVSVPV